MKFIVNIQQDESGMWVVECPSIPGCISQGESESEALTNIQEAIELCLETRAGEGIPRMIDMRLVEVNA